MTADEQRGVTDYKVVPPAVHGKAAVFVVHGMGQQIECQTLDDVAERLRAAKRTGRRSPRGKSRCAT